MKMPISSLVLDPMLSPRGGVSMYGLTRVRELLRAGVVLDPIVACRETKKVTDGWHRHGGYTAEFGKHYEVETDLREYANDQERLLDAVRLNAHHGQPLTAADHTRCILKAEELGIEPSQMAEALGITLDTYGGLRTDRVGSEILGPRSVILKRPIRHMICRPLTPGQVEANKRLGGNESLYYVNQVRILVENDLINMDNAKLVAELKRLRNVLTDAFGE